MDTNHEENNLFDTDEVVQQLGEATEETEILEESAPVAPDFGDEDISEPAAAQVVDAAPQKKKSGVWKFIVGIACGVVLALILAVGIVVALIVGGVLATTSGTEATTEPSVSGETAPASMVSYTVTDEVAAEKANEVVATVGDSQLTNAMLQIFYRAEVYNFLNQYGYYISMFGLDLSLPLDQQASYGDPNMSWQQYFMENAIYNWKSYAVLLEMSKEEGFTLSQEAQDNIDNAENKLKEDATTAGYATLEEMILTEAGAGATVEGFLAYQTLLYSSLDYFDAKYSAMTPTADEIAAHYDANLATYEEQGITKGGIRVDIRHILAMVGTSTDENGQSVSTDADWAACQTKAQQILDQWKAGEATEESFGQLATEITDDEGSKASGGLYTDVVDGEMVTEFNDWIMDPARKPGDTDLVKTQFGYHVMYFCDSEEIPTEEQTWYTTVQKELLSARFDAFYMDGEERFPIETFYSKIVLTDVPLS